MKKILFVCSFFVLSTAVAQKSEELVPSEAITVFSLNNIQLLQKISMDQLVQYDFMEELQQELFDGSTNNKTIKDSGLDFDQKINIFLGKNPDYSISGVTFGVSNKANLFTVFDDFNQVESPYNGVDWYDSYINNLLIKGNTALLLRVEPNERKVDMITDSIWYERGNSSPWEWDESSYGEEVFIDDTLSEEFIDEGEELEIDTAENLMKNYYELRDSIQFALQLDYEKIVLDELFLQNKKLMVTDSRFAEQIAHNTEGTFYFDYSRKMEKNQGLGYFRGIVPSIYSDVNELYEGNIITGDVVFVDDHLEFQVVTKYNKQLGEIYSHLADAKMDPAVKKYIPKSSPAFFVYKVNVREAYEKAYEIIMPILSKEENNNRLAANVMMLDLMNEFINKDAVFDTYKGSVFGSFNGVKKIKTKKIEFIYDEETYDYYEKETEAEEDMPVFTVGISTKRPDIPEKILKYMTKILATRKDGHIQYISNVKGSEYYVMDKAILNAAPLYMINKNGVFIMTNDEDLAKNNTNGYEKSAISGKELKKAAHGGMMYAKIDLNSTVNLFPRDIFSPQENEIIDALRGKSGTMELTTSKTTNEQTNLNLTYDFATGKEGTGQHVLDMINAIYILTK